jgi:hypothetical protein
MTGGDLIRKQLVVGSLVVERSKCPNDDHSPSLTVTVIGGSTSRNVLPHEGQHAIHNTPYYQGSIQRCLAHGIKTLNLAQSED